MKASTITRMLERGSWAGCVLAAQVCAADSRCNRWQALPAAQEGCAASRGSWASPAFWVRVGRRNTKCVLFHADPAVCCHSACKHTRSSKSKGESATRAARQGEPARAQYVNKGFTALNFA